MDEVLARLTPGLQDRYRIERELGSGGMATVFRARDLRHDRAVAIKVLHPEIGAALGAQRFLAEITTTAKLQHPHILPLLDSGECDGLLFYVMPVVEGQSLRVRLQRETQLPIDDAIRITKEVASALAYSHRHGVIHRDIKPENILLHEGNALVADFGIALAVSAAGGARLTATGLSLGTPQYMSPEQATGEKVIDARSDVYSLGCVLYEMLVGTPPFVGASAQAIIAQVITTEPSSISANRPTVPPFVDGAVSRALQKIPADRFQSASEFAAALDESANVTPIPARRGASRGQPVWLWPAVAAACLAVGVVVGLLARRPPTVAADQPVVRIAAAVPHLRARSGGLAIASKGQFVVVVAGDDSRLFVRRMNAFDFVPIAGTEGAQDPFLSPDDQWIAFTANGKLKKVPVDGGPVSDITDATWGGGSWGPDGTIYFNPTPAGGVWRTTADGAKPQQLTQPSGANGEYSHWWPQLLPDGHSVLFTDQHTPITASKLAVVDTRTKRVRVLVDGAIGGRYVGSGHLLFSRGTSTVYAVGFDPDRVEVHGDPKPVFDDIDGNPAQGRVSFAVSPNGTLAFLPQSQWSPQRALVWVDRTGRQSLAVPQPGYYTSPRIAPDGRRLAYSTFDQGREVWMYDLTRGVATAVTHNPPNANFNPVWTPDGRRLIYMSEHGAFQLYARVADLSEPEQRILATTDDAFSNSVSPDGKLLAYTGWGAARRIKFLPLDSGSTGAPAFPNSESNQEQAAFSQDGRWIAYESDESGRSEVYVRPFPNMFGRVVRISTEGGSEPRFARGGREIVFRHGDAVLTAAFDPAAGVAGTPVTLFALPTAYDGFRATYDVAPDGSRFLMTKPLYPSDASAVNIVLNWFPELRRALSK